MSWRVVFTPLAEEDIAEAYAEYEAAQIGLGEAFLAEIDRAVDVISCFPESCPEVHRDFRRGLLRRFPYALYYRQILETEIIEVRAVIHQRRHPRSWRRRA